ncbi:MAG: nucleotidyltransferase family protein [Amaricoccus sp.]
MPHVAAIVLAAGAGRRMRGSDKLLEPVAGRPVLRAVAEAALASRAAEVVVVLPRGATARRAALGGLPVCLVEAADPAEGMAASLRVGLAAVEARADAIVVLLADMPEVDAAAIDRVIAAFDPAAGAEICRADSEAGVPGHPVLFGSRHFPALSALTGDRGARALLRDLAVVEVATPGQGAIVDLDTPEAWSAWHEATGQTPAPDD